MKTIVLFIILVVATGLVNAIQPSTKPTLNQRYSEILKKVSVNSTVDERLLKIKRIIAERASGVQSEYNDTPLAGAPTPPANTTDSLALVALYNATAGAGWTNKTGWLSSRVSSWFGIILNSSGRVTDINLPNNNLIGLLPSALGNMTSLYWLELTTNKLSGSIPSSLGNLAYFTVFQIEDNKFTTKDIEPVFNWPNYYGFYEFFYYSPQAKVGISATKNVHVGDNVKIIIENYQPGTYDSFQWYQKGNLLGGKTNDSLIIASVALADSGNYYCNISNSYATSLTLQSKDIQVNVTENQPPVAYAGLDSTWDEGALVTLDGSGSYDPDGDKLKYLWSPPVGITLSYDTAQKPTFTAPAVIDDTTYTFILKVNDGFIDSDPDTVLITIQNKVAVPETLSVVDTTVRTSLTACFDALQTITVASVGHPVVFQSGSTVNLIGGLRINLMPGFHASSGSHTHAYISTQFCDPPGSVVMNIDEGTKSTEFKPSALTEENPLKEKLVKVYPNPNDGRFTVELSNFDAPVQLTIVNSIGIVVLNKTSIIGENPLLDISYLNRGLYFVKVKSSDFLQTKKIIIK